MQSANFSEISNAAMTANIFGTPVLLDQAEELSFQASWVGTPTGNISVQVSDDMGADSIGTSPLGTGITNWTDVSGSSQPAGGSAGNFGYNLPNIGYKWARLIYTFTSGTGTLNARAEIKGG